MYKKLTNHFVNFDRRFTQNFIVDSLYQSFQQALPMLSLAVYWRLIDRLFLNPNSLFPTIFNYRMPHLFDPMISQLLSSSLDYCVILIMCIALTQNYLNHRGVTAVTFPTVINFSVMFLLILVNFQWQARPTLHYLLFLLLTVMSAESYYWLEHFGKGRLSPYGFFHLGWAAIIVAGTLYLHSLIPTQIFLSSYPDLFGSYFFVHFGGLMLLALLSPVVSWVGIALPSDLITNTSDLIPVSANVNAIYQSVNASIPYPENIYSVFGTFSFLGGVGSTLAISFWLLFNQHKRYQKLGWVSFIPSIFNNNQLLIFGLPIMLRPIMLIPMMLSSLSGSLLGFIAIKAHLIQPAIFNVPTNSPRLLLGYLASQNHWPSLIAVLLIFALTLWIYRPFVRYVTQEAS